ncbi:hypothetical protein KP77_33330 [Jeotgalibacillus alimentarius]|uniref:Uncharacterized protein n=1 Tax=Jeotgalibacillus alimentarius TaxID=135826 RepID=A0A0C2V3L8_9BACL|nr:hypothetical protein [Jeotgalibacillus alimentarius]KIL43627.1 hypothetical protein KP77_33330 [Jeotgalibacillus alimentarius]
MMTIILILFVFFVTFCISALMNILNGTVQGRHWFYSVLFSFVIAVIGVLIFDPRE